MTKNLPQINVRHQSKVHIQEAQRTISRTDVKQNKKLHLDISYSNLRKSKIKKKVLKEARVEKLFTYRGAKIKVRVTHF